MLPYKKWLSVLAILLAYQEPFAQELYPNSEPASIVPRHALGVRSMNEAYVSGSNFRGWNGLMFMYGLNSKLMFSAMFTASNHHSRNLPVSSVQTDTNKMEYLPAGRPEQRYGYLFESVNLGFRYRFVNMDGDHRHFRMALYSNAVYSLRPHDEAEVTLMGDNKAVGGGLISTVLIKKLAVSFTGGIIKPFSYKESGVELAYKNGFNYSLSFGYLVFPFTYKNYDQTNVNLYAEFIGKSYGGLTVMKNDQAVILKEEGLYNPGNYLEFRPAIQFIVKSNLRIDCSTSFPLVNRSYIRNYPLYMLNVQYYFFL